MSSKEASARKKAVAAAEDELFESDDYSETPPPDIVAYNELRSCADLFRMHDQGILDIQPDFQREEVWKGPKQTKFIDSLLKQLPIPSMCFAVDAKKQQWIVIDGLQRMTTIIKFLKGSAWKLSKLEDIDPRLSGTSAAAIKTSEDELHDIYTRIENLTVPITVLRCDFSKEHHMEYLFTIFHRLNSGGENLNNQEIRNGIYGGSLNYLLKDLDTNSNWKNINKLQPKGLYRFRYQEVILRFLAFYDNRSAYEGQLAKFLNSYMHNNRNAGKTFVRNRSRLFERTVDCLFNKALRGKRPDKKIPITILESALVGVAKNLSALENATAPTVANRYRNLIHHPKFSEEARKEGLSKKERVLSRLRIAVKLFAN